MVRVKICGITSVEDARAAVAAGAEMLGFNFYPPSPRFITPEQARKIVEAIAESGSFIAVGVFVNESIESILRTAGISGIAAVQLHGDESPEFCGDLKARANGVEIIKVLRVAETFPPERATEYDVDAIMLDAFHEKLRGGTGRQIDWDIARRTRDLVTRLFLSGGLSPENVQDAIAAVQPYAVDACSSLETSPGKKDNLRVTAFVRAAHNE